MCTTLKLTGEPKLDSQQYKSTLFSEEQLKQFLALLKPLEARLSDIDKQQGDLWVMKLSESYYTLSSNATA